MLLRGTATEGTLTVTYRGFSVYEGLRLVNPKGPSIQSLSTVFGTPKGPESLFVAVGSTWTLRLRVAFQALDVWSLGASE